MNDGSPLVSIVTPSYERESFLSRCIASVQAQSHTSIEHIVVDGGSADGTVDLLRESERRYGTRWISEPDTGMYDAINKGMQMATGSIVAYLNTDDLYFPWTVSTALAALTSGDDIVFGDAVVIDSARHPRARVRPQLFPPFDSYYYSYLGSIPQPTVFMHREVFDSVGQFDGSSFGLIADCDYWQRCAQAGFTPTKIDEYMAVMLDHPDTLRATNSVQLATEFSRLRQGVTAVPTEQAADGHVRASIRWRVGQLAALSRERSHQSLLFGELSRLGERVNPLLWTLWALAPERIRPRLTTGFPSDSVIYRICEGRSAVAK